MSQEFKKPEGLFKKEETNPLAHLKEKAEQLKETKIAETRTITLMFQMMESCGCGGMKSGRIERVVPFDSPLNDGDAVTELVKGDRPAKKKR